MGMSKCRDARSPWRSAFMSALRVFALSLAGGAGAGDVSLDSEDHDRDVLVATGFSTSGEER